MRQPLIAVLTFTLLAGALGGTALAHGDGHDDKVVLISTDYGLGLINGATNGPDRHAADVDDAYAVSLAVHGAKVAGVITTFGNDKAQPSAESARRGLAALGMAEPDALVIAGAEGFLDAVPVSFVPDEGTNEPTPFCLNDGVQRMSDVLQAHAPQTVTLFAIGPFTDVACLQRVFPDDFASLKEIVALVGSADGTLTLQGISVVDFNFAMDPSALGEVIAGPHAVPITFLMFEVTQLGTLSNATLDDWASGGTPPQAYYGQASQPHAAYWDAIFTATDGQALFDAHTVYYFLHPDAYACESDMLATAIVGGYPDTSASTSKNMLAVTSSGGDAPTPSTSADGSTYTYSGPVRGCAAFASPDGEAAFVQAVTESVVAVGDA